MNCLRIFLVIPFFLVTYVAYAQMPYFQTYRLLNQRDRVEVNKMLQDRDGYMWFATTRGLFRFDGKNYRRFTMSDSLADDNVTAIAIDSAGTLWAGYRNGKVSFMRDGKFTSFNPPEGTSREAISDILFDKSGTLWFSTLNDGLYYYRDGRLYRVDEQEGMPDLYIYDLALDTDGSVLAGTDGGVAICSLSGRKVSVEVLDQKDGLPDNIVRKIVTTVDSYYFGSEDAGVIRYQKDVRSFTPLHSRWPHGAIRDMSFKAGQLWIASSRSGILVWDIDGQLRTYNHDQELLAASTSVLVDTEENIWVGSRAGIARTVGTAIELFRDVPGGNVLAVCQDHAGDVWFSTSAGLFRGHTEPEGGFTASRQLTQTRYSKFTVISLYADTTGYLWAGLYGEGALRIDPASGTVEHFERELRNGNVLNITGKGGDIWMATLGGATRVTLRNGKTDIRNYSTDEGLSSDFVYQVFPDSRGRVWFATDGKGIDMFDGTNFHHFQDGLPSKIVYGLTEDRQGNIWANVQGHGLFLFDGQNSFGPAPPTLRPRKNELHVLMRDRGGNLVVAHDEGVDLIDAQANRIKYLGEETGMEGMIANLNSVSRNSSGMLYIGTSTGIIRLADCSQFLSHKPEPRIFGVKVFDRNVSPALVGTLPYYENNLTFNFTGIWYQNPDELYFNYKLENYDHDWLESRDHSVTYSQLPPGRYVFRVRVSETETFLNSTEATVAITIQPPFWRTYTFYVFATVVLAASVFGLMKYRERKLRYNNMLLEARVRARTQEIQRQNDEIQAQNEEISAQAEEIKGINENLEMLVHERTIELEQKNKALEEYAFINAHKLRSPVASILGLAHLMSKTKLDPEGKEINERLQQAVDELDDVVRSITQAIERGERHEIQSSGKLKDP